jgi:hypothetical protein
MVEALGTTSGPAVARALTSTARAKEDKNLYGAGILDARAAAARVFWGHVVLRGMALAGLAWLLARQIRRRGGKVARTPGALLGALVASVGLFPIATVLGLAAHAGKLRTLVELAIRPIGEWDIVWSGVGMHRWLLLASALPAFALAALGFGRSRFRPFIGGVALGTAALLAQMAWSGDVAFVGGTFLARFWEIANVAVCMWLARTSLKQ